MAVKEHGLDHLPGLALCHLGSICMERQPEMRSNLRPAELSFDFFVLHPLYWAGTKNHDVLFSSGHLPY